MPSSRHARITRSAISPRFAISTLLNTSAPLDLEELLAVFDRLPVLDEDLEDRARELALDLVHQFHRLDDAKRAAALDALALLDEGLRRGVRRAIKRADKRRGDVFALFNLFGRRTLCNGIRSRRRSHARGRGDDMRRGRLNAHAA